MAGFAEGVKLKEVTSSGPERPFTGGRFHPIPGGTRKCADSHHEKVTSPSRSDHRTVTCGPQALVLEDLPVDSDVDIACSGIYCTRNESLPREC